MFIISLNTSDFLFFIVDEGQFFPSVLTLCLQLLGYFVFCFFFNFSSSSLSLDERICSPPFMVLDTDCTSDVLEQIKRQGLTFPFSKSLDILCRLMQH